MKKILFVGIGIGICGILVAEIMARNAIETRLTRIEKKQDALTTTYTNTPTTIQPGATESASFTLISEIGRLRRELVNLKNQVSEHTDILSLFIATSSASSVSVEPTAPSTLTFVTISDRKWKTVDVFLENKSSSTIIGQIVYGTSYLYLKKENGYYYIAVNDTMNGWIHSQFVKEL